MEAVKSLSIAAAVASLEPFRIEAQQAVDSLPLATLDLRRERAERALYAHAGVAIDAILTACKSAGNEYYIYALNPQSADCRDCTCYGCVIEAIENIVEEMFPST